MLFTYFSQTIISVNTITFPGNVDSTLEFQHFFAGMPSSPSIDFSDPWISTGLAVAILLFAFFAPECCTAPVRSRKTEQFNWSTARRRRHE